MSTLMTRLTEAEIDAHIAWKASPCTGNCQQGRACDCVADVEEPWEPPFTLTGIALILAPWAIGVLLVALASALI
jgi:hypothetical protein